MITYLQSILLGALQGLTELFPISSLGHSVLLPALLGWHLDESANYFVILLVATHLATALVLLGFFWQDWLRIIAGFFRSIIARRIDRSDTYARLSWVIVLASIPAGILGLLFQERFTALFASPSIVALFLIGNGFLLYGAEVLTKRKGHIQKHVDVSGNDASADRAIANISFTHALGVGFMQALALFPGFSRTGASLAGGLLAGLDHESSARFAFLLATPLIVAAAVLKLPELFAGGYPVGQIVTAAIVSAVAAFLAIKFLLKYFETRTLVPFALYCVGAGVIASFLLLVR